MGKKKPSLSLKESGGKFYILRTKQGQLKQGENKMEIIQGKSFDEERALYGKQHLHLIDCAFTGEADGESAVKECSDVIAENCLCNLRYPFWHVHGLVLTSSPA